MDATRSDLSAIDRIVESALRKSASVEPGQVKPLTDGPPAEAHLEPGDEGPPPDYEWPEPTIDDVWPMPSGEIKSDGPRAKLPVEYFADIKASLDGSYLIKGLIPTDSNVVTFGYPGSGKTFVTTDMALSIAAGLEWHGHKVRQGGVVYIAAEGQAGFRRRIDAWRQEHDITGDIQFASIPVAVDMLNPSDELNALTETIADIANRWGGLAAIAVDTLSATFGGGDENGPDMAAYVGNVARLAAPYRATRAATTPNGTAC